MKLSLQIYPESNILLRNASMVNPAELFQTTGYVQSMVAIMKSNDGVGIAAPQVGLTKRLFVYRNDEHEIEAVLNPQILEFSKTENLKQEGCLSLPGLYGDVWRSDSIVASYQQITGITIEKKLEGLTARIFQHEYDHLNGILFPQRIHFRKTAQWLVLRSYNFWEIGGLDVWKMGI